MTPKNFSMRLTDSEHREIQRLASLQGQSMKDAVMDAVRERLDRLAVAEPFIPRCGGPLEGLSHLVGCFDSGLGDLSTNPDHLDRYAGSSPR